MLALGAALLLKAVLTLGSGTAWDHYMSASRETQPVEFWWFTGTFGVLGLGMLALGAVMWNDA